MVDLYLYGERNENGVNTEVVNEDAPVRLLISSAVHYRQSIFAVTDSLYAYKDGYVHMETYHS